MAQHTAVLAVWVDNCYAFGNTFFGATSILNDLEEELNHQWGLSFKEGSKCAIVSEGGDGEDEDGAWPVTTRFEAWATSWSLLVASGLASMRPKDHAGTHFTCTSQARSVAACHSHINGNCCSVQFSQ